MQYHKIHKLLVVANSRHVKFFIQEDGQRLKLLEENHVDSHHNPEKHASSYRARGTRSHSFDPHTSAKDIDNNNTAKIVTDHLHNHVSAAQAEQKVYEIVITAEPKLLGNIRSHLKADKLVQDLVIKEIDKDFIHEDIDHLQDILNNV